MVQNHLLVDADPSDNSGKTHKIIQTLNEATNKISHTGTAFSSGNWETDTMAYMESIKDLPHEHIQEILTRAEGYMKHARPQRRTSDTGDEPSGSNGSIAPVNKRSRLRICNVHFSSFFQPLIIFIQQESRCMIFQVRTSQILYSLESPHRYHHSPSFSRSFIASCSHSLLAYYTMFPSRLHLLSDSDAMHQLA